MKHKNTKTCVWVQDACACSSVLCVQVLTLDIQQDGNLVDTLIICTLNSVNSSILPRHILDLQQGLVRPVVAWIPLFL